MNILAIETSSSYLSVAARREDGAWAEAGLAGGLFHGEKLVPLIQQVLGSLRLKKESLNWLACGLGPGSFTGLRVGLSTMKGLAVSLRKKVAGFSSLDLIAEGLSVPDGGRAAVVLDARREKIYAAFYEYRDGFPRKVLKDSLLSIDELTKKIGVGTVLAGDGLKSYGSDIRRRAGRKTVFLEERFWYPRAAAMLRRFERKKNSVRSLALSMLKPAYLRLSEAEERRRSGVLK